MRRKRCRAIILTFFLVLMLVGCIKKREINSSTYPIERELEEDNEQVEPKAINPLTGLEMDLEYENRRPIAVMIENEYYARPQSGLDKADVVYEIPAEGGITRFLAIYLDKQCKEIGPVRSARPYFIDLAMEYDSIYLHYGASPQGYIDIKNLNIDDIDGIYDNVTFWRDKTRKKPHNAYTSTDKILAKAEEKGYLKPVSLEMRSFNDDNFAYDEPLEEFKITYTNKYNVSYKYDKDKKLYARFLNGEPHKDRITGETLEAKNVIVQFTNAKVIDDVGRLEIKTVGSGKGYYIANGHISEVSWEKNSRSEKTEFRTLDGETLSFSPGNTWILFVPQWGKFSF